MDPVRIAVVGIGMAAKPHIEALSLLSEQVHVCGIFNRSQEKAAKVSAEHGWPVFESAEQIANNEDIEGVILITPPDQRTDLVRLFARAGKHILTEKPIERTIGGARELVKICEDAGVKYGVVFQHRFRAGAERLKALVDNAELGQIALVRAVIPWWRDQSYYDVPGRGTFARDGGGVLISQAIHVLDLMLSLTGEAESVQAFCATTALHDLEAEDFATGGIRFRNGAIGSVMATTATYPGTTESLVLDGTLGTASLVGSRLTVTWRDGRTEDVGELTGSGGGADPMAFPCDWHKDLIADFARAIREDRSPRICGRDGLKVHALIDALTKSSREGKRIPVLPAEE
ncbi:Gfo/Idh/MocA family protein [Roseibium sp. SCP14]|uniref:Gfo/Idh/MocA family protein n=1 Tax=Roseibium sp. SCP14 TaxID=3141375 RepID=UPI003338FEC0